MVLDTLLSFSAWDILRIIYAFLRRLVHRRPLSIHDLPLELLSDIASYLDFSDILSISQATGRLREATKARVVWHALAKEYSARHFHNVRPENGTIDTLPTDDLRKWVFPRLVLDEMWKKDMIPPPRARFLDVPRPMDCWELLPGGRWLITGHREGSVNFYDLNMENPVCQSLFQSSSMKGTRFIATSIDHGAPVLEFTIAISYSGTTGFLQSDPVKDPHGLLGGIHVGKARFTGAGSSSTLTARSVASIPHIRPHTHVWTLTMSGELIARNTTAGGKNWIEVIQWTKCSSTELMAASIWVEDPSKFGYIYLVGEDRALCVNPFIEMYHIPPLSRLRAGLDPAPTDGNNEDMVQPIWKYSGCNFDDIIPFFSFDGTAHRLVIQDENNIAGISIPSSSDDKPSIMFRMQMDLYRPRAIGLYKGCRLFDDMRNVRFGYGWQSDVNFVRGKDDYQCQMPKTYFDEELEGIVNLHDPNKEESGTVIGDAAATVPTSPSIMSALTGHQFGTTFVTIKINDEEVHLWKHTLLAFADHCRKW
ncbi:hypothetical protein P691DRAFT_775008 [Macrolepiota fuliginosa MF-IS2]|uniref:F-box domain-containing protein n=1 Tax=Macrolepiota fuliginosa MF-IS2 TaxID=1400762 RepID=A0A9P5XCR5_9AGAR|nr:hypothetical protein P691DRAFT_775008 [Macrolepiota fuliginosa MF-IS2]